MDKINPKPKPVKQSKKSKKPRAKKESHGSLVKKAHSIMREIVILRDGRCVCPPPEKGHSPVMQAGHIIKSTKGGVRFDLRNVHAQCRSCNSRHTRQEWYYIDWFLQRFGQDVYHELREESEKDGLKSYELSELIVQLGKIKEKQLASSLSGEPFKPYYTQKEILSGSWATK